MVTWSSIRSKPKPVPAPRPQKNRQRSPPQSGDRAAFGDAAQRFAFQIEPPARPAMGRERRRQRHHARCAKDLAGDGWQHVRFEGQFEIGQV